MIFSSFQIPETPEALRRDGADGEPALRPGPGGARAGAGHLAGVQPPLKVSCHKAVTKLSCKLPLLREEESPKKKRRGGEKTEKTSQSNSDSGVFTSESSKENDEKAAENILQK